MTECTRRGTIGKLALRRFNKCVSILHNRRSIVVRYGTIWLYLLQTTINCDTVNYNIQEGYLQWARKVYAPRKVYATTLV
jgi:hypothetical protein